MKKRILEYRTRVDSILEKSASDTNWEQILEEHLVQISFFQHERLIHLIVTITFALMTMLALGVYLITGILAVIALLFLLLVLLVPYVMHYYLLENETQKMYEQYDQILKHIHIKEN